MSTNAVVDRFDPVAWKSPTGLRKEQNKNKLVM
jgi:hypothetical protein